MHYQEWLFELFQSILINSRHYYKFSEETEEHLRATDIPLHGWLKC